MENQIYDQISSRTGGDIYIGVVGPVRTGKSTFIKRFMETMVLPDMENPYKRERARDELPQSGTGRTIMTAEPKFVPEEAAEIALPEGGACRVRLVDCVGYLVEGAPRRHGGRYTAHGIYTVAGGTHDTGRSGRDWHTQGYR